MRKLRVSSKNIVSHQKNVLAKDQIVKSLLETQTLILVKLAEQKHERNDQQHAILPCESNKSLPVDFLQQYQVQKNQAPINNTRKTTHITAFKNTNGTKQSFSIKYYWTKNSFIVAMFTKILSRWIFEIIAALISHS